MALISNRQKNIGIFNRLRGWIVKLTKKRSGYIALAILAVIFIYFVYSKTDPESIIECRGKFVEKIDSAYRGLAQKFTNIGITFTDKEKIIQENKKLKAQMESTRAQLYKFEMVDQDNADLMNLLQLKSNIAEQAKSALFFTYFVDAFSGYASINIGKKDNVQADSAVFSDTGLIGRVVASSENYSQVMLLSNLSSRVPVITAKTRMRAIVAGKGDDIKADLVYLIQSEEFIDSEAVLTSGDGLIFPRGILVGYIKKTSSGDLYVELAAQSAAARAVLVQGAKSEKELSFDDNSGLQNFKNWDE